MKYLLTNRAKKHVEGHFNQSNVAGSIFRPDYFPAVESVLNFLVDIEPICEIMQSGDSIVHCYKIDVLEYVGWGGVGKMTDFPEAKVQEENRNGYMTRFIEIGELPATKYVNIVFKHGLNCMEMITIFPGMYAPAFPKASMSKDDFLIASKFWDEHILLKKQSC